MEITTNVAIPVEFQSDTFPIVGLYDDDLRRTILDERQRSAADLWDTRMRVNIAYASSVSNLDDEEKPRFKRIIARHEQMRILFEAKAITYIPDKNDPGRSIEGEEIVAARASIGIQPLLSVLREYMKCYTDEESLISHFKQSGDIPGMTRIDEERKLLHKEIFKAIDASLKEEASIRFSDDPSNGWRALATAVAMHVLPAPAFRNGRFFQERVWTKPGSERSSRGSKSAYGPNPFRDGPNY